MSSLKQKTFSGVKWQVINKVAQKVISILTFGVLARILTPSIFGLFALGFVAIDGFHVFKTFGLDTALIRRKGDIDEAADTAYVVVQAMGVVLFGICFVIAPFAAQFFHNPNLVMVIRVLALIFVLNTFSKIPSTLLTKQMRFDVLSVIDLIGSIINSACAIAFALISPTVWCLVWAYLIKQTVITVLSWYFSGFRFKWRFNFKIAKELFNFGKFMLGLSILWYIGGNIDNIVVGRILGAALLGYYALASNIGDFINTHFIYVLESVMFPAYSSIQHDREEVTRVYLKTTKFVSFVSMPFSIALVFLSKEIVAAFYGVKWLSIVPLIQILGSVQFVAPILICSGSVFLASGKPQYNYRITLCSLLAKIPCLIFFTHWWGLLGAVCVDVVTLFVTAPINVMLVRKLTTFRFRNFLVQFLPSLCCSLIMLVAIQAVKVILYYHPLSDFAHNSLTLLTLCLAGVVSYVSAIFFIDRDSLKEGVKLILKLEKPKVPASVGA